jgi:hypothetical protein
LGSRIRIDQEQDFIATKYTNHTNAGAASCHRGDLLRRRLIHGFAVPWDWVPRAACGVGCLSKRAWTASPSLASIRRLGLWARLPSHQRKAPPTAGTAAHSPSRTHVSKQGFAEQARLLKRRPAQVTQKAWPSGRREASRTAMLWTETGLCPRRQPFGWFVYFVVGTSFGAPLLRCRSLAMPFW